MVACFLLSTPRLWRLIGKSKNSQSQFCHVFLVIIFQHVPFSSAYDVHCTLSICLIKKQFFLELFIRLCGAGRVFNHHEGIMRGWNGDKPWIIIYNHMMAEVIKY